MKVLIAPNAFKNSISAFEATEIIDGGLRQSELRSDNILIPIADGGEGSLSILAHYFNALTKELEVANPIGKKISAKYALNKKRKLAIIELAEASGIWRLKDADLNPWITNTYGTGELINDALSQGCQDIILTVGGSATIDGGAGILRALNVNMFWDDSPFYPTGPCDFHKIDRLALTEARERFKNIKLKILVDVNNRLLGNEGAVNVYGEQKGLNRDEHEVFENTIAHWASLLEKYSGINVTDIVGGGASGGVPAGLAAVFNTEIISGAEEILKISGFIDALEVADIVITGEGQIDAQTGNGKGPGVVAKMAHAKGKPVIGICGQISDDYNPKNSFFTSVFAINSKIYSEKQAIQRTRPNLKYMASQIGNLLALKCF